MVNKKNGNEDLLLDGLIKGDSQAFEKIYHQYIRELYLISMGYLNNGSDADDVVQEAFIYLWNNRHTLKPNSNIRAYLRKIVKNASLNSIRNRKIKEKHKNIFFETRSQHDTTVLNQKEHEEQSNAFESKLKLVRTRLEQLPKGCKKAFIMSVIDGLTYKEVSSDLGVSVNTVKTQVRIAYRRIRE